jgi:hypothetical protein
VTSDVEPASFRDPEATVFTQGGRVFRGLSAEAAGVHQAATDAGLLGELVDRGWLIEHWDSSLPDGVPVGVPAELIIEARAVPVVSYPYEWSFSMLRDAALLTLDVTEACFRAGFQMKDASAYNVLFDGGRPMMIDLTSFDRGFDGAWTPYGQFCDHFLAPLLLEAHLGVPFQPYLRGRLSGIPVTELAGMFPGRRRFKPGVFSHIYLRSRIENKARHLDTEDRTELRSGMKLPVEAVIRSVQKMRGLVESLTPSSTSVWSEYENEHSYGDSQRAIKEQFVDSTAETLAGNLAWDVGANTGAFSEILAKHFKSVVALDHDAGAVDAMYRRLRDTADSRIVPLVLDVADPSPDRGWRGKERRTLLNRATPAFATWLAVIHHICLAGEVPVAGFLDLVADTSPDSIVEFVGPDDPMSRRLMATRKVPRPDYSRGSFLAAAEQRFTVVASTAVSPTRDLFHLRRG